MRGGIAALGPKHTLEFLVQLLQKPSLVVYRHNFQSLRREEVAETIFNRVRESLELVVVSLARTGF